ncbi:hypothetical protein ABT075_13835 [Streptomyces sp. NPDC002677]|uniref:hypothetical protein n=1 Tax=Streptomyces sp. NPDC002677 TaxID=3154774 RepID=UPI00332B9250
MPDNNDKYNGGGFTQGGDGAVYGDSGSTPGSTSDYDTWDWKQIQAAIVGMSAGVHSQANEDHAAAVASPQSLRDAADILAEVQGVLATVAQSLTAQAKALAGDNGPWQGAAADAFAGMIDGFSKQVQANVEALAGGSTGAHNVPQQVADNAVNLANAQHLIAEIDVWYANQARQMGVQPMSNGLIPISKKPQLVEMMTNDMRKVLKSLAGNYRVTIDNIKSPSPIDSPGTNTSPTDGLPQPDPLSPDGLPDTGTGLDTGTPDLGTPDGTPAFSADAATGLGTDGTPTPFSGSLDPGGTGALGTDGLSPNNLLATPSAFPDDTGTGTGVGADGLPGDVSAFPGDTGTGAGAGGLPGDVSAFPGDTGTGVGVDGLPGDVSAFPGDTGTGAGADGLPGDVSAFPGDTGTGLIADTGTGAGTSGFGLPTATALPLPGFSGSTGTGDTSLPVPGLANSGSAFTDDGLPTGFPGDTGLADTGAGLPGTGAGLPGAGALDNPSAATTPSAFPGDLGLESPGPTAAGSLNPPTSTPTAFPGATDVAVPDTTSGAAGQGSGAGMPFLPPGMGAPGGAGAASGASEPSDSSGLLDNVAEPWTGSTATDPVDVPTVDTAALPGAGSLDLPTSTPAAFPGGTGVGVPDGAGVPDGVSGFPGGADTTSGAAGQGSGAGMPFLPPGMGAPGGAGAASGASEPSDSSGLLDNVAEPWTGSASTDPVDAPTVDTAALPGAGSLDLPTSTPAAFPGGTGVGVPDGAGVPDGVSGFPGGADTTSGAAGQGSGAGMPFLPPGMGAPGGAGVASGASEPSDSSGLLDNVAEPWTGSASTDPVDVPTVDTAALPGAGSLDLPTSTPVAGELPDGATGFPEEPVTGAAGQGAGAGMPFLPPGMGAPGAAGAASGVSEPSDSSGLLDGSSSPWEETGNAPAGSVEGVGAAVTPGGAALAIGAHADGGAATPSGLPVGVPGTPVAAAAGPDGRRGAEPEPRTVRLPAAETEWADTATDESPLAPQEPPYREAALLGEAALVAAAVIGGLAGRTREETPPEPEPAASGPGGPDPAPDPEGLGAAAEAEEDFAAWDRTDGSFVPLLLSTAAEEEGDGPAARFSGEDEETWTGVPGARSAESAPSGLVTWQPSRQQPSGTGTPDGFGLSASGLMCADVPYDPELDEENDEDDEEDDGERKPAAVSAADLLVQDHGAWGEPDDTDNGFL